MTDPAILGFVVFVAGLIFILVLGYLSSNNKLKPPFQRPAQFTWSFFSVSVFLLIASGIVYALVDKVSESGWVSRTREVSVYFPSENWLTGEIRTCTSLESKQRQEIGVLLCDHSQTLSEPHTFPVKFWGPITTDRNKIWKCTREAASLTCRLQ
jgi:hypothetical protein